MMNDDRGEGFMGLANQTVCLIETGSGRIMAVDPRGSY